MQLLTAGRREKHIYGEIYQKALNDSGYKYTLTYKPQQCASRKTRKRNITWYNPPYDKNVKTNLGHEFLQIIKKCFPRKHPLSAICNRNTLKLSYCCMPNVANIVQKDRNRKIQPPPKKDNATKTCNCRVKTECPLEGKCLDSGIIYQAEVKSESKTESYVGLTSTSFKTRFYNHKQSFTDSNKKTSTELSKYIWQLKEKNSRYTITWKILARARPYNNISKRCDLCLTEKLFILCKPNLATLNKRTEYLGKCRHMDKFTLSAVK